MKMRNASTQLV